jgi:hypothetical protein
MTTRIVCGTTRTPGQTPGQPACKRVAACLRGGAAIVLMLSITACSPFRLPAGASPYAVDRAPPGRQLVGVSLSGGGNRSALYASYVLELLASLPVSPPATASASGAHPVSFADRVAYVSSVSGGSFASAWFGLSGTRPTGGFSPMIAELPTPAYDTYFDTFHEAMNTDWEWQLVFGLHVSRSQFSNASRLAGAIDSTFLHGQTMADLERLQNANESPYLVFNATDYDSGRRFVMTTLPTQSFCIDVPNILARVAHGERDVVAIADQVKCGTDILTPVGFDSIALSDGSVASVDSSALNVSRVVATSGAFPGVVGPLAYSIDGHAALLHLIDGGLTDNAGVESLAQLFLRKLIYDQGEAQTGLIVEVDASLPFDTTGEHIAHDTAPAGTLLDDVTRPSDIQEVRASYYRHDLWALAQQRVHGNDAQGRRSADPDNAVYRLTIIKLQHTEFLRKTPDDPLASPPNNELVDLQHGIRIDGCGDAVLSATDAHAKVSQIPTRYNLSDHECAASMLRLAACWSVHLHGAEIQQALGNDHGAIPATRIHRLCHELKDAGAY